VLNGVESDKGKGKDIENQKNKSRTVSKVADIIISDLNTILV